MDKTDDGAENRSPKDTGERNSNAKDAFDLESKECFMATALLAAGRSEDPVTKVGACIVNEDDKIVGVGYNCMPKACKKFRWDVTNRNELDCKHFYVCHAEMNAILNKNSADLRNCRMYVTLFPCNECAKLIIQSGIKSVFYIRDKHCGKISNTATKMMFKALEVECSQYKPKNIKIYIDSTDERYGKMSQPLPTPAKKSKSDC